MLDERFLTWWHEPWRHARRHVALPAALHGALALRDGYPLWCELHALPAALPARCEPAWATVAAGDPQRLHGAAALYGGLLAARERASMAALEAADRRWCASLAAVQPLRAVTVSTEDTALAPRGLAELAGLLDEQFAGLWPRLRLQLAAELDAQVAHLRAAAASAPLAEHAAARARRCWNLCLARIDGAGTGR